MEIVSSIFYGILFLGIGAFMCIVPFMFFVFLFQKKGEEAESWMYILSGVITLTVFFIAYGHKMNWDNVF